MPEVPGKHAEPPGHAPWWQVLYERQHQIWPGWAESDGNAQAEARFLLGLAGREGAGSAIDLGCGSGRLACALAERGWRVLGIDISPDLVQRAQRRAAEKRVGDLARFALGDLRALTPERNYDLMLFWDSVLSIWPLAQIRDSLSRLTPSLAPGGTLVLQQLNPSFFLNQGSFEFAMEDGLAGPGRTERRYIFDPSTKVLSDHVVYRGTPEDAEVLPVQRLHLAAAEAWLAVLKSLGFCNLRAIGSDGWALGGLAAPVTASSAFFVVQGRRE